MPRGIGTIIHDKEENAYGVHTLHHTSDRAAACFCSGCSSSSSRSRSNCSFKLLINTGVGYIALLLLNAFGVIIGVSLGLNWVNALVIGVFGYPGLILLLLLKYF